MFDATEGIPAPPDQHRSALREQPTEELVATYRHLDALEAAVRAERMTVLAILDERSVGSDDGSLDTAAWVADTSRVTRTHARELVETARALQRLPALSAISASGTLSWDQLTPLAQIVTADTDEDWAQRAPGWTPAQLLRHAKAQRAVTAETANDRHRQRSVTWWKDSHEMVQIRGQLPDVLGATVVAAIERLAEPVTQSADGEYEPFDARCADALGGLASQQLANDAEPDRACVVIHVPVAALASGNTDPGAELATVDIAIANETAQRLFCDSTFQPMLEAADGATVAAGRRTRSVPAAMRRRVWQRDRCCRLPGCNRTRGVQVHHIVHHADGGVTEIWNLVLLCSRHHRFVHEHRWRITGDPGQPDGLEFLPPDGRRLGGPRPPLRPDIRARILEPA